MSSQFINSLINSFIHSFIHSFLLTCFLPMTQKQNGEAEVIVGGHRSSQTLISPIFYLTVLATGTIKKITTS